MKKGMILVLLFVQSFLFANDYKTKLENNDFFFRIFQLLPAGDVYYDNGNFAFHRENDEKFFLGYLSKDRDVWNLFSERNNVKLDILSIQDKDECSILCTRSDYSYLGNPYFINRGILSLFMINVTSDVVNKYLENGNNEIIIDFRLSEKYDSPAISICNNLRIRENPDTTSSTKIIGKLQKWDKVLIIDYTNDKMIIDGLEYPWYKIRLKDGLEGWVFGGFVKIYTNDEDLNMLYKAFEKEGSEYTNQFEIPDYS